MLVSCTLFYENMYLAQNFLKICWYLAHGLYNKKSVSCIQFVEKMLVSIKYEHHKPA